MRKTILFILTLIILPLAIAVTGCGEGMDQGTSEVTIIISDNHTASLDIKKPSIFASLKYRLKKIIEMNEVSALPPGIADIRYTISGPGMSAITGVETVYGDTVRIVLYIPNGQDRVFTLDARYSNKCVRYRGVREVDLNGSPTKLGISMNLISTDLCASNASVGYDITFTLNNSGNNSVSNVFYYVQYQISGVDRCSSGTAAGATPLPANSFVTVGVYSVGADTTGNYRIIIDPLNAITETDDSNNEICSGIFCTSPPPLSIC